MAIPPRFGDQMDVDRASELSSSSISSLPNSPQPPNNASDVIRVSHPTHSTFGEGVVRPASATSGQTATQQPYTTTSSTKTKTTTATTNGNGETKIKRSRKKKLDANGNPIVDDKPKEKKPRKPREPKEKATGAANGSATGPRKKQKTEEKAAPQAPSNSSRQPTVVEAMNGHKTAAFQTPAIPPAQAAPSQSNTFIDSRSNSLLHPTSNPPTPRPLSSGQNYDPIRSATIEPGQTRAPSASNYDQRPSSRPSNTSFYGQHPASTSSDYKHPTSTSSHRPSDQPQSKFSQPPSHPTFTSPNARASPSIMSLIDPPMATKPSPTTGASSLPQPLKRASVTGQQPPPVVQSTTTAPTPQPQQGSPDPAPPKTAMANMDGAMEIDCDEPKQVEAKPAAPKSNSSGPAPKNSRPTPPPPKAQKGTGSGLLSSSDLFGGPSTSDGTQRKGVDIDIRISLNPAGGNIINMAQEIVKKYGRDAINPRAAAHREALLRVAAEANRIEGGATDDMSLDEVSDQDDSNVEMSGANDGAGPGGLTMDGKPRQRRKKIEEYDKEDDFIDDTELAWQEQAAVAKDGFFVYSGPLVPEGQAARVEANAPIRGAGRGRGRGRRAAGAAATGATHASVAETKAKDPNVPATTTTGRGRGKGSRGGATTTTRKPRITKADREHMEKEKLERERAGANESVSGGGSGGTGVGNTTAAAMAAGGYVGGAGQPSTASAAQHSGASG